MQANRNVAGSRMRANSSTVSYRSKPRSRRLTSVKRSQQTKKQPVCCCHKIYPPTQFNEDNNPRLTKLCYCVDTQKLTPPLTCPWSVWTDSTHSWTGTCRWRSAPPWSIRLPPPRTSSGAGATHRNASDTTEHTTLFPEASDLSFIMGLMKMP